MAPLAPWLLRVGALMILLSPLLPQARSGVERYDALRIQRDLAPRAPRIAPLLLAGVTVARGLEKGLEGPPPLLERLSFALLLGLHGLFLADSGWALLLSWAGTQAPVKLLGGAAAEPLGAALLAVGGFFSP